MLDELEKRLIGSLDFIYPDIDTVPDFEDLVITKEESIDLCKLTNTDNKSLSNCLDKIENNQNK